VKPEIQHTKEEWASIIDDLGWNPDVMEELKQKGYIRKTAVEEAEEEYIAYKEGKNCFVAEIVMDKMYVAIQELKSEIARLKK
jgi:hypothetical protein